MATCEKCFFYRGSMVKPGSGECMANPPVVMALPMAYAISNQPQIGLHAIRPTVLATDNQCRHWVVKAIST